MTRPARPVSQSTLDPSGSPQMPGCCPGCFAPLPAAARRCPACGLDMRSLSARDYFAKLVHALRHPLADVRMRAIIALGWHGDGEAAPPLVECALRHPADVVQGLQIVESLGALRDPAARARAFPVLAGRYPAHAVRDAAIRALDAAARVRK
jgi:HEAT repeat protein